ncbi:hypothetical protein LXL04_037642 [Taraxacum kok-saghyz]
MSASSKFSILTKYVLCYFQAEDIRSGCQFLCYSVLLLIRNWRNWYPSSLSMRHQTIEISLHAGFSGKMQETRPLKQWINFAQRGDELMLEKPRIMFRPLKFRSTHSEFSAHNVLKLELEIKKDRMTKLLVLPLLPSVFYINNGIKYLCTSKRV